MTPRRRKRGTGQDNSNLWCSFSDPHPQINPRKLPICRGRPQTLDPRRQIKHDAAPVYRPSKKAVRFDFEPGRGIAGKYRIESLLGTGWEGEVYSIVERNTGIRRAAKFYYPHRDPMGKAAISYARKLDALRHCPILMQYHHQET